MKRYYGGMFVVLVSVLTFSISSPVLAQNPADVSSRVEQRRSALKTRMNAADKARVVGACVAVQQKIGVFNDKFTAANNEKKSSYDAFAQKLNALAAQNPSDPALKAANEGYIARYKALQDAVNAFMVTTSDLKLVDCKAEPNGFKATLDTTRSEAKTVKTKYTELLTFVKTDVIPAISKDQGGSN